MCSPKQRIDIVNDAGELLASTARGEVSVYSVSAGEEVRTERPGEPPHRQSFPESGVVVEMLLPADRADKLAARLQAGGFGWTIRFSRLAGGFPSSSRGLPPEAIGKNVALVIRAAVSQVVLTRVPSKIDKGTAGKVWVI